MESGKVFSTMYSSLAEHMYGAKADGSSYEFAWYELKKPDGLKCVEVYTKDWMMWAIFEDQQGKRDLYAIGGLNDNYMGVGSIAELED
jgi:hypothetical protein